VTYVLFLQLYYNIVNTCRIFSKNFNLEWYYLSIQLYFLVTIVIPLGINLVREDGPERVAFTFAVLWRSTVSLNVLEGHLGSTLIYFFYRAGKLYACPWREFEHNCWLHARPNSWWGRPCVAPPSTANILYATRPFDTRQPPRCLTFLAFVWLERRAS